MCRVLVVLGSLFQGSSWTCKDTKQPTILQYFTAFYSYFEGLRKKERTPTPTWCLSTRFVLTGLDLGLIRPWSESSPIRNRGSSWTCLGFASAEIVRPLNLLRLLINYISLHFWHAEPDNALRIRPPWTLRLHPTKPEMTDRCSTWAVSGNFKRCSTD